MNQFLNQPWWVIALMIFLAIIGALFIGRLHIVFGEQGLSIWVERPVTAILVGLAIVAGICEW